MYVFNDIFYALLGTALLYTILDLFILLKMRWVGVVVFSILITADIATFCVLGSPLNYGIIASIFETNMNEVESMSKQFLPIVLVVFALITFLLVLASKEMKKINRIPIFASLVFLLGAIVVLPLSLRLKLYGEPIPVLFEYITDSPLLFFTALVPDKYPFVIGDLLYVSAYLKEMSTFNTLAEKEKALPLGVEKKSLEDLPLKVLLVVGESARRDHMSLYGYQLPTTPFFDSLHRQSDKLIYFDNVIAPATNTREAIRITLSFSTARDKEAFWEYKNVVDLANDVGYKTFWITTQSRFGMHDSYSGRVSASASEQVYNSEEYKPVSGYQLEDFRLLPVFESRLKKGEKQFFVLHLNGSHISYGYDETDTKALGNEGETIEYDKSIYHTDRLLSKLHSLLEKLGENYVLLYYSDHGEVINVGHSIANKYKDQYKIPLVLISDTLTNEKYLDKINKYYNDQTKRLSTSNLPYFLGEIIGYGVSDDIVTKAKSETEYLYQADGRVKTYSEIRD